MSNLIETAEIVERVILLGVNCSDEEEALRSLDELARLADTAGAQVLDRMLQNREKIHPASYLGKGKIEEVRERIEELGASGVICDDELSPAQMRNLENALSTKIMDRTMLILDIFAKRASTSEGKIQVELAQLKYSAARLVGLRASLSRLGGGIGTRGPGEKKIDMDRRRIHERIGQLKTELEEVKRHRALTRKSRSSSFIAAIVGYTNAGKSTLLNLLSDSEVLTEDKLFATLDPTTRKLRLGSGQEMLITDTVGFIRKLPHNLIEAFKSTLEEAKYADLIIHLVDGSSPEADTHMLVVYDTLRSFDIGDKEIITVYNKIDHCPEGMRLPRDFHADHTLKISARTGEGVEELKELLESVLRSRKIYIDRVFAYREAGKLQLIRKWGELLCEEYTEEGIAVKAWIPSDMYENICEAK